MTTRGTSNSNRRGGTHDRRARRAWIMRTYASDVAGLVRCYRCGHLLYNPDDLPLSNTSGAIPIPLTIDRIIAGCRGGTYRRNNIRPCCNSCNMATGGYLHAKSGGWRGSEGAEETWKS